MESKKPKGKWGGARPGAGRPKGSRDRVSVKDLLDTLEVKSGGQSYEEMLAEDFLRARANSDNPLVQKYHHLISSKVMSTLMDVEVGEPQDIIAAKQQAFAEAIAQLAGIKTHK
jgi:hypothetical protein